MSLTKRKLRIQRTLEFLERDVVEKELRRKRRAQKQEEEQHKKDILVVDSGRPVYFWHWKVHKNTCDHGYLYVKTNFRINSTDQVLHVDDNEIVTAPTTPRVGSSNHTPRPPDNVTPRPPDNHTPRPPDKATPRSARSSTSRVSISINAVVGGDTSNDTAPLESCTPRPSDKRKNSKRSSINSSNRKNVKLVKPAATSSKNRVMVSMLRGTRVIARNDKDGMYYPGKVLKCPNVRHATVEFTDGSREVLTRFILPVGGAVACPKLSVGDYALVQVVILERASECFVPSIVQVIPQRRQSQIQFYTVMLYNGQKVTTRRNHLVKISKERFELSARYIAAVQGEDRKKNDDVVYVSQNRRKSSEDRRDRGRNSHKHRPRSPSPSSQDSRSHSRTLSRSRSRSASGSRSRSPASRPRSPTPGVGFRESPSPPRSASLTPRSSREKMKIKGKRDEERLRNSERKIEARSRSRSESESPSRQDNSQAHSRSRSCSRSRSRSPSSSPDRKDISSKRSRSRSGSRSPSSRNSELSVHVEIRKRSTSREQSRSRSPTTPKSDRQKELGRLERQLKKKQEQQDRERRRLKKKAKKLSKMEKKLLEHLLDEKKESSEQETGKEQEQEEEEVPITTPRMLHLRRTLPELQAAEEVLARFSDDGWYYRGTVQQNLGDLSYIVEDATGYIERIWREDIISDYDDNAPVLQEDDRVVAQHPRHISGSYAPGCVLSVDDVLQTVTVKFYDGEDGAVPRAEIYRLPREKYNQDVLHIQHQQRGMLGLSVVARDESCGMYYPGQVTALEEGGKEYIIRWSDGSQAKQIPVHIFSAKTRRPRLLIGDRVLAMANPEQVTFMPGQIVASDDKGLVIRFCDGQIRDDVNPLFCYWLSQRYFEEASYFWRISQPDFGKKR